MGSLEGYFYIDSRGREILHVPLTFVAIYSKGNYQVILEPNKLKRRFVYLKRDINYVFEILEELLDIPQCCREIIMDFCFQNKIQEAEDYIINLFEYISDGGDFSFDNLDFRLEREDEEWG